MLRSTLRALFLSFGLVACVAGPDVAGRDEAIVDGTYEPGMTNVYYVLNYQGGACTGALISPRVVLTARHCVVNSRDAPASASAFRIYAGSSERTFYAEYRVSQVHIIPGSTGDTGDGNAWDLGLLVLTREAAETPLEVARDESAHRLIGLDVTAVGFGQTPSGTAGTKYRGVARVTFLQQGIIFVDPVVCSGDSGGPLIGDDGRVYGVASFIYSPDGRSSPVCGTAPGGYNELYQHMAWIDSVLESVGDACFPDAEICNGEDDDCNGIVDDPCLELGEPCSTGEECTTGLCEEIAGDRICTMECDPTTSLGCGLGAYCAVSGCSGRCALGTPGTAGVGTSCSADLDCASALCRDPGDGIRRCLAPCERDLAQCLSGEVCVPLDGSACGGCVSAAIVAGARALGEPCGAPAECASGSCVVRAGLGECAAACVGGECADGFVCEDDMCVTDRRQPVGGRCVVNSDCETGICASLGDEHWCTAVCVDDAGCPGSFRCDTASHVCAPDRGLEGAGCTSAEECVSGLCATTTSGGMCVTLCGTERRCGVGLECTRTSDGAAAVCTRPPQHGGCSATRAGALTPGSVLVFVLVGLALVRRRTR